MLLQKVYIFGVAVMRQRESSDNHITISRAFNDSILCSSRSSFIGSVGLMGANQREQYIHALRRGQRFVELPVSFVGFGK
ncbi:MAG TPA: hypothetical protein VIG25_23425 [Pyrinomonadaceae bacterium]